MDFMNKVLRLFFVLIWLGMVGVFVVRQARTNEVIPAFEVAAETKEGNEQEWFGVYVVGRDGKRTKIGYSASDRQTTEKGYLTKSSLYMKMAIQGETRIIRSDSSIITDLNHRLRFVDFSMRSDLVKFKVLGTVRDHDIRLEIETAGGNREEVIPLPEPPLMPDDFGEILASEHGLTVGNSVDVPFFDPATFRYDKAKLRVTEKIEHTASDGTKLVAYRVETDMVGITAQTIVDENGRTLEQTMANIVMVREPHSVALSEGWDKKPVDLPDISSVRVARLIPNARQAKFLKVRLAGVKLDDLAIADERQAFADNVLTVTVNPLPRQGTYRIPFKSDDPQLMELLKAAPFLEVDDPAIRTQAAKIVPPNADALGAARAIFEWVFKNVDKRPLISMTSAKDVLQLMRGDCNEHASLFAALARAAGIPATIHVGLVYLDGAFYYHAWNGAYVGEWISLDATFGQFPADATHLRIVSGGLDRQVDIVRFMGNLKIDVLESR